MVSCQSRKILIYRYTDASQYWLFLLLHTSARSLTETSRLTCILVSMKGQKKSCTLTYELVQACAYELAHQCTSLCIDVGVCTYELVRHVRVHKSCTSLYVSWYIHEWVRIRTSSYIEVRVRTYELAHKCTILLLPFVSFCSKYHILPDVSSTIWMIYNVKSHAMGLCSSINYGHRYIVLEGWGESDFNHHVYKWIP